MFYIFIHVDTCKTQQLIFVDAVYQALFYDSHFIFTKLLRSKCFCSHFTNKVHLLPRVTQMARQRSWDPNPETWIRKPWTQSLLFCQGNGLNGSQCSCYEFATTYPDAVFSYFQKFVNINRTAKNIFVPVPWADV